MKEAATGIVGMFGTSGIRGPVGEEVTGSLAVAVGRAVASDGATTVVVGRDPRDTGEMLVDGVSTGVRECGGDVIDVGIEATPTVARAIDAYGADAGVVVTASHNPPEDNGFKLWNPSGQAYDSTQRDAVSDRIENGDYTLVGWDAAGERRSRSDAAAIHRDSIVAEHACDEPLSIVVDIGNGAGQLTADALTELGCSVTTLHARRDGRFPGRPSEPTDDNLEELQSVVAATDHDLGIAHDGDADRMMAVDDTGAFLGGDELLAVFARATASPGDTVAVPVNTSLLVDDVLDTVDASTTRTQVGDVSVADAASDGGVVFGGEPSGAWIWPGESLCPDGPLAAVKLAALVADHGPLSVLHADFDRYPIHRDSIETDDKDAVVDTVASIVHEEYRSVQTLDGVRVTVDDGWFLVRASGTQPLVRVTAEGRDESAAANRFRDAKQLVERAHRTVADPTPQ